jgi:hypothetical protein
MFKISEPLPDSVRQSSVLILEREARREGEARTKEHALHWALQLWSRWGNSRWCLLEYELGGLLGLQTTASSLRGFGFYRVHLKWRSVGLLF